MRRFWPVACSAQADYESLRAAVLADTAPVGEAAGKFARQGLAGLISRPAAEGLFEAVVGGASRPPWTPYRDPRLEALAAGYRLLLGFAGEDHAQQREVRT